MPDTHPSAFALRHAPTVEEQRSRIEFMEQYPAWHFMYSEGGTYTASKSLGGADETVHLVGRGLGEAVEKARAYEEGSGG